jgi:hypothetical protein
LSVLLAALMLLWAAAGRWDTVLGLVMHLQDSPWVRCWYLHMQAQQVTAHEKNVKIEVHGCHTY